MTGNKTVQKATFNYSGSRVAPILDHINGTVEQVERPLMTPDEVMRLKPAKKEGDGDAERIVEAGDMLIFVSGHFPIYGRQLLYFFDPELAKRVGEAPPTVFKAIEDGAVVSQRRIHRTLHVMSRPEFGAHQK